MNATTQLIGAILWLAITFAAAFVGSRFLPDAWYDNLRKPTWNPPKWVFAPVWTLLYLLMAAAAWLAWRDHGIAAASVPLGLFVIQLGLNAAWSWLFFGRHEIGMALAEILLLWAAIAATALSFYGLNRLAGSLMIPYLLWVTFAAALNLAVWRLNGPTQGALT